MQAKLWHVNIQERENHNNARKMARPRTTIPER
jgi:hypothetical protein